MSRCVVSQERRRVKIAPRQFGVFSARFSCAENGAGERHWHFSAPLLVAAARSDAIIKVDTEG